MVVVVAQNMQIYLMPLNFIWFKLKMVKMVNFTLCIFYKKKNKSSRSATEKFRLYSGILR